MTKNLLNKHTCALEMGELLVTANLLKVQAYICKVLKEQIDLRHYDISLIHDLTLVNNCLIYR